MIRTIPFVLAATMLVGACVSNTAESTAANEAALERWKQPGVKAALPRTRRALVLCAVNESLRQIVEDGTKKPDRAKVQAACQRYEIAYRASVMAQVRSEWQRQEVLINTANAATRNLYGTVERSFR